MYRPGSVAVIEDRVTAEAEFVRVTAISASVPVAVVVKSAGRLRAYRSRQGAGAAVRE